ncbi:LysR family transcriptional regulator [Nitratireductor luteus]|uniref:LysR family transcriptional regulator n=1 Tax=Nitratireductor luteus TaxID=2976980 RepID=UPI003B84ACDA
MPQLSEIRRFVAAAENGSLRRAAETIGVGQSCLSRTIMRLEDKLGVSLLERSNTGARLTNAGQRFLDDVEPALRQLEQARRSACAAGRADRPDRRPDLNCRWVSPETACRLSPGISEGAHRRSGWRPRRTHRRLRSRELDNVLMLGSRPIRNCECAELWCERLHIARSKKHRLASQRELDCLTSDTGNPTMRLPI